MGRACSNFPSPAAISKISPMWQLALVERGEPLIDASEMSPLPLLSCCVGFFFTESTAGNGRLKYRHPTMSSSPDENSLVPRITVFKNPNVVSSLTINVTGSLTMRLIICLTE